MVQSSIKHKESLIKNPSNFSIIHRYINIFFTILSVHGEADSMRERRKRQGKIHFEK